MTVPAPALAAEPGTVQVWSDIGCPWAHAAVWRLWDARRRLGLEDRVRFDHRVFPLELFNSEPTPRNELEPEIPICSSLAPRAGWQAWSGPDWAYPVTMLPPMEAVQAAKEQGLAASEALDRCVDPFGWTRPATTDVHTFVARNAPGRGVRFASSSPVVCSARPYIGELSMTVPPAAKSASSTAGSAS